MATVRGVALVGLRPSEVRVEASSSPGLPALRLVGLPDAAVRESGERVRTAVQRQGLRWPAERLVINLAPADLPKVGTAFDLPLAIAVLAATGQVPLEVARATWACGELGLDGSVRAIDEQLPIAAGARELGAERLLVPAAGAGDAAHVPGLEVVPVADLAQVASLLRGTWTAPLAVPTATAPAHPSPELADVRGQALARRAIEIAAAGGHHVLLSGPPGCGKTMLAQRLHGLLPDLVPEEALEVAAIHSLAGERRADDPMPRRPPLRAPHQVVSTAALVGGGSGVPRPGELSLAHRGVLLLDELLELPRPVLDALRQPLESGEVVLTRARARVTYPASVMLVAATNPCPCGHLGNPVRSCTCRPDRIERYRARLSGPLLDRLDLQVALRPLARSELLDARPGEDTATVAARVAGARAHATVRWGGQRRNRDATAVHLRRTADPRAVRDLAAVLSGGGDSARAFDRVLRVARTIADLDGDEVVRSEHLEEALAYRLPPVTVPA